MGFWRDMARGVARAGLEALQKAAEDDAPDASTGNAPDKRDDAAGAPDDGDAGGDADEQEAGEGGPPKPPPPPPARKAPEPTQGTGPTLAAPAMPQTSRPRTVEQLEEALADPKSLFWDPFAIVDALGYKDRPSPLTYQTLNSIVWKMPIVQSIIQTRVKQVSNFSRVQVDKYSPGFRVRMRDRKAVASPASEARSHQIEQWLLTTGSTENPGMRDSFSAFLQKIVRDSLTYDQATFEIVPARSGKPAEFYAVDAATIRIADTTRLFLSPKDTDVVRYVQIYDGLVIAEYTGRELCFGIRNPTSNIRNQQYGQSEVEMLVTTITALLWAFDYNQKFFSQGTAAKGIINFKGAIPEKQMRAFRRHWYSMVAGIDNAFKTPIVNADDMQWVNMQSTNKDMEYNAWMDFLIKIIAAIYGMDPMEVNFKYGDSGGGGAMFESANTSKLTASKDKGLKPLLETLEHWINAALIQPLDPDFAFEFVGLEANTPTEQADLNGKLVKTIKTVNEARAEEDMPPLPNGLGDIILDPVWFQHLQMSQQQQQQSDAAQAGGEGAPALVGGEPGTPGENPEEVPSYASENEGAGADGESESEGQDESGFGKSLNKRRRVAINIEV